MLKSFEPAICELAKCRRLIVVLLNQLDLRASAVRERHTESRRTRLATEDEVVQRLVLHEEEGANADNVDPMLQRTVDVVDHKTQLAQRPEVSTHEVLVCSLPTKPRSTTVILISDDVLRMLA
jgi:hypothetical protein